MHAPPSHLPAAPSNGHTPYGSFPEASGKCLGRCWGARVERAAGGGCRLCTHLSCSVLGPLHVASTHRTCSKQPTSQISPDYHLEASGRPPDRRDPQPSTLKYAHCLGCCACTQATAGIPRGALALPSTRKQRPAPSPCVWQWGSYIRHRDLHLEALHETDNRDRTQEDGQQGACGLC
jgi:hypothetical protein